jgi:ABC-type uncharacterized transport system ATPase subunit
MAPAPSKIQRDLPKVYILVTGLNGAGKSTFIKKLTGDANIKIGETLESCE